MSAVFSDAPGWLSPTGVNHVPPRRKTEQTKRFRATDSFGKDYALIAHTHFIDTQSAPGGAARWVALAREYKLDDGRHVNVKRDGSFEIVTCGTRLWRA